MLEKGLSTEPSQKGDKTTITLNELVAWERCHLFSFWTHPLNSNPSTLVRPGFEAAAHHLIVQVLSTKLLAKAQLLFRVCMGCIRARSVAVCDWQSAVFAEGLWGDSHARW